jgi:hypothetical protein
MRKSILICLVVLLAAAVTISAGEKKLMHCFTFTAVDTATDADWQAWFKATDALPGQIPGLSKVWYGKLARPQTIVTADGKKLQRQWGVCMEMDSADTLKAYAANPAHKKWDEVYGKVRVPGTTTFNIIGQ